MSASELLRWEYFMESEEEVVRLDVKTDPVAVRRQARWAGVKPGMRVADIACGPGKTTYILYSLVKPSGSVVGVDYSEKRLEYARKRYGREGIEFVKKDITKPLDDLGTFDFVWIRFLLEYYRSSSFDILKNVSKIVKPGGILCLIDLDHNCLNYYGLSEKLEKAIFKVIKVLTEKFDFDPYAGRKLYSYLYQLGYEDIKVHIEPHHLIYGKINEVDYYNWSIKLFTAINKLEIDFSEFEKGKEQFIEEVQCFLKSPQRFIYTPLIMARGIKPFFHSNE